MDADQYLAVATLAAHAWLDVVCAADRHDRAEEGGAFERFASAILATEAEILDAHRAASAQRIVRAEERKRAEATPEYQARLDAFNEAKRVADAEQVARQSELEEEALRLRRLATASYAARGVAVQALDGSRRELAKRLEFLERLDRKVEQEGMDLPPVAPDEALSADTRAEMEAVLDEYVAPTRRAMTLAAEELRAATGRGRELEDRAQHAEGAARAGAPPVDVPAPPPAVRGDDPGADTARWGASEDRARVAKQLADAVRRALDTGCAVEAARAARDDARAEPPDQFAHRLRHRAWQAKCDHRWAALRAAEATSRAKEAHAVWSYLATKGLQRFGGAWDEEPARIHHAKRVAYERDVARREEQQREVLYFRELEAAEDALRWQGGG